MTIMLSTALGTVRRPHIVVINRWRERYAEYARYIDHQKHLVTYVTTRVGLDSVPAQAAERVLVDKTDDWHAVSAAVRSLVSRHGAASGVIALKEDDLEVGARLRLEWGCAGQLPAGLAVFRDKLAMCQAIQSAGLPLPAFASAPDAESVLAFADVHGWPVILKPRIGSASEGVVKVNGPEELAGLSFGDTPTLVQAYVADPIHHVDGVFDGGKLLTWRASRYLNTCLDFRTGTFLGSVEVDEPELHQLIGAATTAFMSALTNEPTVFHLEMFVSDGAGDGTGQQCAFLEVGARAGGAEIPFIWREVHGYDLAEAAVRIQLGQAPPEPPPQLGPLARPDQVSGWLLLPAPTTRPCRITAATSMVGRVPGPYAEALLRPGDVLPAADAYYEHVGGRFRFRGPSSAEVAAAVVTTAEGFHVAAEPLPSKDYSIAVLNGHGDTDYARYMRTDTLLSLQRSPAEMVHRDELLFQTVHQSTELWLKHACYEVEEAARQVRAGVPTAAALLLDRAALGMDLVTQQLEMMRHLSPWDFQTIRTVLGHGSGFESPGWRSVRQVSQDIGAAFDDLVRQRDIDLVELYRKGADQPMYRLAEAMMEWDERISVWRVRHYKIATRIIGHDVTGTKGTPVDTLAALISHKFFPPLWRARTELTRTGPMGDTPYVPGGAR